MILKNSGFPVALNGFFMGLTFLLSSFIMKKLSHKQKWLNNTAKSTIYINLLISIILLTIVLMSQNYFVALFLMLLLLTNHLRVLFSNKMLNESISNDNRATTLSYVSLIQSLAAMTLAPIYGKLYDMNGGLYYIIGIILLTLLLNIYLITTVSADLANLDK